MRRTTGTAVAAALRAEADAIAADVQAGHAAIVAALIETLGGPLDRPLGVLVHGDPGALSGGLVGTGITALRGLRDQGRELHVFVTETRPFMDGARLAVGSCAMPASTTRSSRTRRWPGSSTARPSTSC